MTFSTLKNLDLNAGGPQAAAPTQQQAPQTPGQAPTQQQFAPQPSFKNADFTQPAPQSQPAPAVPPSPMDKWEQIFNNDPVPTPQQPAAAAPQVPAGQQQSAAPQQPAAPTMPTPVELNKALGNYDFSKNVDPAKLQLAMSGGEGAEKAMLEVLSTVGRNAAITSSSVSVGSVDSVMQHNLEQSRTAAIQTAGDNVKFDTANALLVAKNPQLASPALQTTISDLMSKFGKAYPNAKPQEIADQVAVYVGSMFAPVQNQPNGQQPQTGGWDDVLENYSV